MFHIYIIYSESADKYYVGHSDDPSRRIFEHNNTDELTYTSKHRPWRIAFKYPVSEICHNPLSIAEVKYKFYETSPACEDYNQTIVYANSYGTKRTIIVQPTSDGIFRLENLGTIDFVTLYCIYLDLSVKNLQDIHDKF